MYDYIVVGAGSAGCVVAARLSEDPACRVLLLEAGGPGYRDPRIATPGLSGSLWRTKFDWGFSTEPQPGFDGRSVHWPRGKILGGTSCLNYMVYIRGHRDNYDEWAAAGNDGWSYADVLPYFKRSERNERGASEYHGADGPLDVTSVAEPSEISRMLVEASATACNIPRTDDFNGARQEGAGMAQVTIRDRRRCSTALAFLEPAMKRPNLTVHTGALVERITFHGTRASGVRYRRGGRTVEARVDGEVVLCAGAVGSPHILMLSGVGPAAHLGQHGIDVVHDAPGVGKNLQDHVFSGAGYTARGAVSLRLTRLNQLRWMGRYLVGRRGPLASNIAESLAFARVGAGAPRPDVEFHFVPSGAGTEPNTDNVNYTPKGHAFSILATLLYPDSRGQIRLRTGDPADKPLIDPRYLSSQSDLDLLVQSTALAREIARTAPVRDVTLEPISAASDATASAEDMLRDLRLRSNTLFHPVGTCKMGSGDDAVVDAALRVRGVDRLRVADASIMPRIVGGNTNAPCIMIGEKASDLLRA